MGPVGEDVPMKANQLKAAIFGGITFSIFGFVILIDQYGEFDRRDLPSKLRISAKADSGYHIHAELVFYPTREIPLICIPIMGTTLSGSIGEYFNDIPESGVDLKLKRKWAGLCKYQFEILDIACTQTLVRPYRQDGTWASIGIGILESEMDSIPRTDLTMGSQTPILDGTIRIEGTGILNEFYGCKSNCGEALGFGINKSIESIAITCKEK